MQKLLSLKSSSLDPSVEVLSAKTILGVSEGPFLDISQAFQVLDGHTRLEEMGAQGRKAHLDTA